MKKAFFFQPKLSTQVDSDLLKTQWGICSEILRLYGNFPHVKVNATLFACKVTPTTIDFEFDLSTVYKTKAV